MVNMIIEHIKVNKVIRAIIYAYPKIIIANYITNYFIYEEDFEKYFILFMQYLALGFALVEV